MKLQFDANQEYQLEAIKAGVDIFKGQPVDSGGFRSEITEPAKGYLYNSCFVVGNRLDLDEKTVTENVQAVQEEYGLEVSEELEGLNFSLEMETGTGKTYVYLRTIHELNIQYGFKKYIIVVPSLAIKEGVLKNLQITKEHFDIIYEKPQINFYLYDPRKRGLARNFATANNIQVVVMNIDQFARAGNIIYQESDWGVPAEYIKATRPIVIVDEPQNMETENRKQAIANLNPLCTLRYSATHKYHYNLIYNLNPVKAYDLGLVKKIEVDGIEEENANLAFVELKAVKIQSKRPVAKIKIDVATNNGIVRKDISAKSGQDLYDLSGNRDLYSHGYIIDEVDSENQSITFSNGTCIYAGQKIGGLNDEIMKFQIESTIRNHFDKEKRLEGKGIKVLSLFFIDRVANYRQYTDGQVTKGKFAEWFEELYKKYSNMAKYKGLGSFSAEQVHDGYFSQDKKGVLKDTRGDTKVDDSTYNLIMKNKERLLSQEEPVRFIFSHSALREGWDNPNVFQICTLNETHSIVKKRQEIGRGLRLPVNQDGKRVFDDSINVLTVTANENYEDFARALQSEIEDECGVEFGSGRIKNKKKRRKLKLNKCVWPDYEEFKKLWDKIKHRTRYQVEYNTESLIDEAGKAIAKLKIKAPRLISRKARFEFNQEKIEGIVLAEKYHDVKDDNKEIPDVLGYIQNRTKLTKDTILKMILKSDKLKDILTNPQEFMDMSSDEINRILQRIMVDGIKYEKVAGRYWNMTLFESEELYGYLQSKGGNLYKVKNPKKTVYDCVLIDSEVERRFAKELEEREDIKFYLKLPFWFKIDTPLGTYNPDWGVVFEGDKRIYFVAETKSHNQELRPSEAMKIECGKRHFENFEGVEFVARINRVGDLVS